MSYKIDPRHKFNVAYFLHPSNLTSKSKYMGVFIIESMDCMIC